MTGRIGSNKCTEDTAPKNAFLLKSRSAPQLKARSFALKNIWLFSAHFDILYD